MTQAKCRALQEDIYQMDLFLATTMIDQLEFVITRIQAAVVGIPVEPDELSGLRTALRRARKMLRMSVR